MIIFRYLAREIYRTLFAVTLILVLAFLVNQTIRWLNQAASGDLATDTLLRLIALQTPYLLGLLLPLGLYLGILISYSRMYAENEMVVLFSSGMSRVSLIKMTLVIATSVFLLVASLMLFLNPYIAAKKNDLIDATSTKSLVASLVPGSFQSIPGNKGVVYVGGISSDKQQAQELFIAQKNDDKESRGAWTMIAAATGEQVENEAMHGKFVVAKNGYRYQISPGENNLQVVKFDEYGLRLNEEEVAVDNEDHDAITTKALIANVDGKMMYLAELHWRIALPISVYVLVMLGVALSKVKPRQGRFQQLAPAILLYIIYANLIFVGKDWLENGEVAPELGLWWVHGIFLSIAFVILMVQSQCLKRLFSFKNKVAS